MRCFLKFVLVGGALAVVALGGGASSRPADQPAASAPDEAALLRAIIDRARDLEAAGATEAAMMRYAAALALEPGNAEAKAAFVTLAAAPRAEAPAADPRTLEDVKNRLIEQRSRWDELRAEVRANNRALEELARRMRQTRDALDDDGRAEPITDRLERQVEDLERRLERTTSAVERVQRDVDRVQREVDRVRSRP